MNEESQIKCFKCQSHKFIVGFPRVTKKGKPQMAIVCSNCGWEVMQVEMEWGVVKVFDLADKIMEEYSTPQQKEDNNE